MLMIQQIRWLLMRPIVFMSALNNLIVMSRYWRRKQQHGQGTWIPNVPKFKIEFADAAELWVWNSSTNKWVGGGKKLIKRSYSLNGLLNAIHCPSNDTRWALYAPYHVVRILPLDVQEDCVWVKIARWHQVSIAVNPNHNGDRYNTDTGRIKEHQNYLLLRPHLN